MTEDVTKSLKQVIDGIGDSLGINPSALLSSFAGTKLAMETPKMKNDAGVKTDAVPETDAGYAQADDAENAEADIQK